MRHYGSFPASKRLTPIEPYLPDLRPGDRLSERVQQPVALLLKIFYDGAEVNGLIRESPILGDFGLIEHFESVAFKQFEPAPAVEGHHLGMDLFDTVVVQMMQENFDELPSDLNRFRGREKVDVEMPNGPGRAGHFTPGF
jgi:hypothetical protein